MIHAAAAAIAAPHFCQLFCKRSSRHFVGMKHLAAFLTLLECADVITVSSAERLILSTHSLAYFCTHSRSCVCTVRTFADVRIILSND